MTDGPIQPHRTYEPAYGGSITFCRTALVLEAEGLQKADVAILGAPFDEGVSFRPGARFGPRAIRLADDTGTPAARPHMELGVDPFAELSIVDYGDIEAVPASLDRSHTALRQTVGDILDTGTVPVVLGGDHSLAFPMMSALSERFGPDGYAVMHFDAHTDTGDYLDEIPQSHGVPFRLAVRDELLSGGQIVQIGLRGPWPSPEEFDWMRTAGFRWHTMDEIFDRGITAVVADAIEYCRRCAPRTYMSVDIDVLDPAFAPGTGTPVAGGLSTIELLRALRAAASSLDICAMDLVEVSPPYDPSGITALAGHQLVLEALSGMALRRSGRQARPERSAPTPPI
jgi:agmatinase